MTAMHVGVVALDVTVPGKPTGAARPRFVRATGRAYMPDNSVKAEASAMVLFQRAWGERVALDEPVRVNIDVVVKRPQSLCRKKDPTHRLPCMSKPDADNVAKLLMDALSKAGVYVDDTRVVELRVCKQYAAIGEQEHCRVVVARCIA